MKKIIAAIAVLGVLASCKKDTQPSSAQPLKKVTSIERTIDGANKSVYSYDQQNRLSEINFGNNYRKTIYTYKPGGFEFKQYNNNNQLTWEVYNATLQNGRLTSASFRGYYDNGQVSSDAPGTFTYNLAGYLVKLEYPNHYMTFEYTNGNCTKVEYHKSTGEVDETTTLEYYPNLPNKFNLVFFEYSNYLPMLHNTGTMGKANANLVKKVTIQNSSNTRVTEYRYTTDAQGYATTYAFSSVLNGGAAYSETYTINY